MKVGNLCDRLKLHMPNYTTFDIAGPIMVGPSSSHTAGAVKIGQMARALFDKTPEKVTFTLHGSFATVYKGHATDRALIAGVMKLRTADPRIKEAFEMAKEKGIDYKFETDDLGLGYHPNTVKILLESEGYPQMTIIGSSIGGGKVVIKKINEFDVDLKGIAGKYMSLIMSHIKRKGIIAEITAALSTLGSDIVDIQSLRVGEKSLTFINLEGYRPDLEDILQIESINGVEFVRALTKLGQKSLQ
jgi:L-serine dehydratase